MTLYELNEEFKLLLELAEDPDVDPETLEDTIEALTGDIEDKADGYAKVIRQMEHDAAALDYESKQLRNKKDVVENRIKHLKAALQNIMETMNRDKIETQLFKFRIQNNPPAVVMDEQYLENIPDIYLVPQDPKVDKTKIKEDLKAGKDLNGIAHLEQTRSLRIK